ncbi:nucleoid-associated protein [Pragia fontium]|uniref:nucleoid-associated protein n=1 Tax=Pragia fontium TaxID=82985 RepID=UPI000F7186B5|nr:nucleoid-associated protein [Pragia fontium]VEJ54653.1 Nucleoid-associated protein YejK [Pragia fontium]
MSFNLHNVIIHQLVKDQHKDIKPYHLRDTVLDSSEKLVLELVKKIASLYGTKYNTSTHGVFNNKVHNQGTFPSSFDAYFKKGNKNSKDFVQLSVKVMDELQERAGAKDKQSSSGGYILFAEYTVKSERFLFVAMIKNQNSYTLTDLLDPALFETLDLGKLNQAMRINYSRYNKVDTPELNGNEINYLSFISSRSSATISGYFIEALGCSKSISTAKMTSNVINLCTNFFKGDDLLKEESINVRVEIINYLSKCEEKRKPANLSDIGSIMKGKMVNLELENDEIDKKISQFLSKLNSDEVGVSNEFNVNKTSLNKYKKVNYKGTEISFNFDCGLLGDNDSADVYYDKNNKKLTFSNLDVKAREIIEQAIRDGKVN